MFKILVILISISFLKLENAFAEFNMTAYKQMPPLHKLDDYDQCLEEAHTYCVVYAEIQNDTTSDLWHSIEKFSSDTINYYRHDKIFFGVCVEKCKQLLQNMDQSRVNDLYVGQAQDNEIVSQYSAVHKRDIDLLNIGNNRLIGSCLNYQFQHEYNLSLRTQIEYCENRQTPHKYDFLDYGVWLLFAVLVLFNVLSSIFDCRIKRLTAGDATFYNTSHQDNANRWLTAFSLQRNWNRLTRPPKSPLENDLKFFDAYRTCAILLVIFVHCLLILLSVPAQNPDFFEKIHLQRLSRFFRNGTVALQIFFVMSAFLVYVNFVERQLVTKTTSVLQCIGVYGKIYLYRVLRLVPSMLLLILFNASVLPYVQDGPFWRHTVEAERISCRENWWTNVLFLHNFMHKGICAEHTWYMAAEMQMFQLFLIVIILFTKYPRLKIPMLSIFLAASIIIPIAVTFVYKMDVLFTSHPEFFRYMFFKNAKTYFGAYVPFYTNLSGYLFGILSADLYVRKLRGRSLDWQNNFKLQFMWFLLVPLSFALLYLNTIFVQYNSENAPLLTAFLAGIYRILWMPICCLSALGMCCKLGSIAYEFCCLPIFRVLGRISYQAYLWHIAMIFITVGYQRQPIYLNLLSVTCFMIYILVLTVLVSLLASLCFEIPMANIVNCILTKSHKTEPVEEVQSATKDE